ncbi:MAG: C-GCAxxG-C-C family protein [Desulfovibrio sp.]|nr:C-GCAxxG-C-C family protein [Desulfovibrio sp.]
MDTSRRNLLCGLGGLALGGAVAGLTAPAMAAVDPNAPAGRFSQVNGEFGWKPHKLDPAEVAMVAYDGYWYKGYACGYGVFYSIIGLMGEKYGAPYNQFPYAMLEANKGGISDWGTICGALYGAAAAYALFWGRKERTPMVNELYRWYEVTKLPIYNPGDKATGVKGALPQNSSGSVLCHISVSKWCYAHKIEATSKERSERCGRITADVATKAVEILNAKIDKGKDWKGTFAVQAAVAGCGECHQTKGNDANWAKGVMDCTPCHNGSKALADKFNNHP